MAHKNHMDHANNMGGTGGRGMDGGGMDGGGMGGGTGGGLGGLLGGLLDGIRVFTTDFTALNNSGVHAHALLFFNEAAQKLTVHIRADGLEPGQVHAQHIHGFLSDMDAKSPTIAQDVDLDGIVELFEGEKTYGPIQLNLTTEPGDAEQLTGLDC